MSNELLKNGVHSPKIKRVGRKEGTEMTSQSGVDGQMNELKKRLDRQLNRQHNEGTNGVEQHRATFLPSENALQFSVFTQAS